MRIAIQSALVLILTTASAVGCGSQTATSRQSALDATANSTDSTPVVPAPWHYVNNLQNHLGTSLETSVYDLLAADGKLYAATLNTLYASSDLGSTWTQTSEPNGVFDLVASPADPNRFYFVSGLSDVLVSSDALKTSSVASSPLTDPNGGCGATDLAPQLVVKSTGAVLATSPAGIYRSLDGAKTWAQVYADTGDNYGAIKANPAATDTLFAGLKAGVLVSQDGGATWTLAATLGNANNQVLDITFDAHQTVFVATTQGVYRSTDAGRTFASTLNASCVSSLAHLASSDGDTIYAMTDDCATFGQRKLTLLKTLDGGATWRSGFDNLQAFVQDYYPGEGSCRVTMQVDANQNLFLSLGVCGPIFATPDPIVNP